MQTNVLQHAAMQIASERSTFSPALIAAPPGLRSNSSACASDSSCPLMPLKPSVAAVKGKRAGLPWEIEKGWEVVRGSGDKIHLGHWGCLLLAQGNVCSGAGRGCGAQNRAL